MARSDRLLKTPDPMDRLVARGVPSARINHGAHHAPTIATTSPTPSAADQAVAATRRSCVASRAPIAWPARMVAPAPSPMINDSSRKNTGKNDAAVAMPCTPSRRPSQKASSSPPALCIAWVRIKGASSAR